jgi:hypothetical protein
VGTEGRDVMKVKTQVKSGGWSNHNPVLVRIRK